MICPLFRKKLHGVPRMGGADGAICAVLQEKSKNRQKGVDKLRVCRYTKGKSYPEQPKKRKGVRSYGYLPSY